MRVVHVAPTPFGREGIFGGGERFPLELSRALARHVSCELVTFGRRAGVIREPGGLVIRTLRPMAHLRGHPAHPVAPGLPAAVSRADVVHTHHYLSAPSKVAALTARAMGRRAVVTDHGLQGSDWLGLLSHLFDRFLLVSEYSARELDAPSDRTTIILGGADPKRYTPEGSGARSGVLYVGRITPHKGLERLLAALPEGAELTVAGTPGHDPREPERHYPRLVRTLSEGRHVRFLDAVPDEDLPQLYRSAAVLVVPSVNLTCYGKEVRVSELLGLSAIEAMASGTPVVASRVGGLPEVVAEGETGFLVEPGNVAELRDRLEALLRDGALAERLGRRSREVALERFTWDRCAERVLPVYGEL